MSAIIVAVMSNPDVARITARIGQGGRSPLYRWLWEHFDEVRASWAGRPDWVGAAAEFAAMGYLARGGQPLSADAVRKTWKRVEADRGKVRIKPAPIGAAVRPRPDFSPSPPPDDEEQFTDMAGKPI